jgi:hypothetical protein
MLSAQFKHLHLTQEDYQYRVSKSFLAMLSLSALCFFSAAKLIADRNQIDRTSPPSIRSCVPVIQRAAGETRKAIRSAISSGSP